MTGAGEFDGGLLVQRLVYAGLEAMRAAAPLDLAAYLHEAPDQGPQLFLGAPTLGDIDPSDAFNLFSALRDGLGASYDGDEIGVPGYRAIAVTTTGASSRGVHVLGRRHREIGEAERATLAGLMRTFGALAHTIEEAPHSPASARPAPVRVGVETVPGGAQATVEVAYRGEVRAATAEAPSTARAVALAAVGAVDPSMKVIDAGEERIGDARAVLALVAGADGRQALGAALLDEETDSLRATAVAALDAAARLLD